MGRVVVDTVFGKVAGSDVRDALSFKGIPYAASTGGANRFRPPQPPEPWTGIREATAFGSAAPQADFGGVGGAPGGLWTDLMHAMYPEGGGPVGPGIGCDEDCLVLNVWTPRVDDAARPVMVWLHGGAFLSGAGSESWFHADAMASRGDVVVVTVNHRLGILGYLDLASIGGDRFDGAGVAGMLDIIAALRWVKSNIAKFGGDPDSVTIFGQSGGGAKVSTLLVMPDAAGLFHRAIIQSGAVLRLSEPEDGMRLAKEVLDELGVLPAQVAVLQDLPIETLLQAQAAVLQRSGSPLASAMRIGPVIDGQRLPHHPFDPSTPADIPLLIGTNVDEMAMFLCGIPGFGSFTDDDVRAWLTPMYGDRVDGVLATYRSNHPQATPTRLLTRITSDSWLRAPSVVAAERTCAGGGAPVFMYLFTYETPILGGVLGSCHSLELPFVFDTVDRIPYAGDRPDRYAVAGAVRDAWTSFARCGDPAHPDIPTWQPWDPQTRSTMLIDVEWRPESDPFGDELRLAADVQLTFGESG